MKDSLGRSWQLGTVQLDYSMPERFDLVYTGADDAEHRPVMIHRAAFGSYERFIGILIEHLAGELPGVARARAGDRAADRRPPRRVRRRGGRARCATAGVRVEVDERSESVGRKIRDAELRKIPLMLVVGDREAETGTVSVREHGAEEASRRAGRRAGRADRRADAARARWRLRATRRAARSAPLYSTDVDDSSVHQPAQPA